MAVAFAFSLAMSESFCCNTSSLEFAVASALDIFHSKRCVALFHCCFGLKFSNGIQCWTSFHILIWHLYIFFLRHLDVFAHFKNGLFVLLLLSFKSSWYMFDASTLWNGVFKYILLKLFKYIYWLCYYSCPISPPSLHSILPTHSLPHSLPIIHVLWSYI